MKCRCDVADECWYFLAVDQIYGMKDVDQRQQSDETSA